MEAIKMHDSTLIERQQKYIKSKIEMIIDKVVYAVTNETLGQYEKILQQFKNSFTYQQLNDLETELLFEDIVTILEMWKHERRMDVFLDEYIKIEEPNNRSTDGIMVEIKRNLKKQAFNEKKGIEEVYLEFTNPDIQKNKENMTIKSLT